MKPTTKPEIYSALIVDDEQVAVDHLSALLLQFPRISVIGKTIHSGEVMTLIATLNPDLVFLDIQMPKKNGLEILKEISVLDKSPRVIMVTAYDQFVLDALRNNAFDYLLKPCDPEELTRLVERLDHKLNQVDERKNMGQLLAVLSHKIGVRGVYEDYYFSPSDILYLEAEGKYTRFHLLSQKPVLSSVNLCHFEQEINASGFVRISRSHVINTGYLFKTDKKRKMVVLKQGEKEVELPYSGIYLERF